MSIGRTKEEQELTALLRSTIVEKEVMEPMGKIGWSHGTPPPPDYTTKADGQPAPAEGAPGSAAAPAAGSTSGLPAPKTVQPAPAGQPKADTPTMEELVAGYEALRDPETGLIARKYQSVPEAIKGGVHLTHMAKQAFGEAEAARKRLLELEAENLKLRQAPASMSLASSQAVTVEAPSRERLVAAKANLDKVLSRVSENGGVLDADTAKDFSDAQLALSEAAAEVRVLETSNAEKQASASERAKWTEVDAYMAKNHPKAELFSDEVALHLQSDPLLARAVNALVKANDLIGATEHAWLSFEKSHGAQVAAADRAKAEEKEADLAARGQVREELVDKARRDAGVVTGSTGGMGVHENRNAGVSREEIVAAREAMTREGDAPGSPAAQRFRQLIIPLDPAIFGPR